MTASLRKGFSDTRFPPALRPLSTRLDDIAGRETWRGDGFCRDGDATGPHPSRSEKTPDNHAFSSICQRPMRSHVQYLCGISRVRHDAGVQKPVSSTRRKSDCTNFRVHLHRPSVQMSELTLDLDLLGGSDIGHASWSNNGYSGAPIGERSYR